MARKKINSPVDVVERNITLVGELMNYLIAQPHLFNSLPEDFELIILPDDDPEMRVYNLELINQYGNEDKPSVFARIHSTQERASKRMRPSLYVPIAA